MLTFCLLPYLVFFTKSGFRVDIENFSFNGFPAFFANPIFSSLDFYESGFYVLQPPAQPLDDGKLVPHFFRFIGFLLKADHVDTKVNRLFVLLYLICNKPTLLLEFYFIFF